MPSRMVKTLALSTTSAISIPLYYPVCMSRKFSVNNEDSLAHSPSPGGKSPKSLTDGSHGFESRPSKYNFNHDPFHAHMRTELQQRARVAYSNWSLFFSSNLLQITFEWLRITEEELVLHTALLRSALSFCRLSVLRNSYIPYLSSQKEIYFHFAYHLSGAVVESESCSI